MSSFRTLDSADVRGKRVLLRVDLNVPMENGRVSDATRIERVLPTIREIADKGGKVILLAHFGRPKGGPDEANSLRPVAAAVADLYGRPVGFAADCIGPVAEAAVASLKDGDVLLLENTRFHKRRGEERSRLRRGARQARRPLRQRRVLRRPPRARLDRRRRAQAARLRGPRDAGRTRRADAGARQSLATGRGDRRRRQGFDQARSARQSRQEGRHADHRRRHGEHVPRSRRARRSASRCARRISPTPRARS